MKKSISLLLCILILFSVAGCSFLSASENVLQDSMDIPENGIVEESVFRQIMQDNAVVVFQGECGNFRYEWTVFGSDISEPKALNLQLALEMTERGVRVDFQSEEYFGFSPVLSVYLDAPWDAQNATVYKLENGKETALCSASVTGGSKSVLNFAATETSGSLLIVPNIAENDNSAERTLSDGTATQQDKYLTDPVPEGKPMPVEPENSKVKKDITHTCKISIECSTILNNIDDLNPDKLDVLPSNGIILKSCTVTFYDGESVFDVLKRVCAENGIQMEASFTPMYNSAYVEGIHNLYEFDCGTGSGWMYRVNGWYPNYGCSRYQLRQGDVIEWRYTCNLGGDIGGGYAVGG